MEQVIEQDLGIKEPADSFMKKYGDLENEKMVNTFSGILIGMGVSNALLATAVVAVSVIVIHIGIKAFCEDCE